MQESSAGAVGGGITKALSLLIKTAGEFRWMRYNDRGTMSCSPCWNLAKTWQINTSLLLKTLLGLLIITNNCSCLSGRLLQAIPRCRALPVGWQLHMEPQMWMPPPEAPLPQFHSPDRQFVSGKSCLRLIRLSLWDRAILVAGLAATALLSGEEFTLQWEWQIIWREK